MRSLSKLVLVSVMLVATVVAAPARADTISVDCPSDDLQAAIGAAAPGDVLAIRGACVGTFLINNKDLTLRGEPAATLDGDGADAPVLEIGGSSTVVLARLTITGANRTTLASGGGVQAQAVGTVTIRRSTITGNQVDGGGAGIYSSGTLTIVDSTISGNSVSGNGGGILGESASSITITNSTVSGNTSEEWDGGGISTGGALTLTNSTVSGNVAAGSGGGIFNDIDGNVTVQSSTITDNTADSDNDGDEGGGIVNFGDSFTLTNTILAGNTDVSGDATPDCGGQIDSGGQNIVGDESLCDFAETTGDQVDVDPLLGPLADNGGPTETHALEEGSPAIDAAGPSGPSTDQRGVPRNPDIGAYERAFCGGVLVNRVGTAGRDVIVGTPSRDGVLAFAGNDRVRTKGGDDAICAGRGADRINAGGGADWINAGRGRDTVWAKRGQDVLLGKRGRDLLRGGRGSDVLNGGPNRDTCKPGPGNDVVRKCEAT